MARNLAQMAAAKPGVVKSKQPKSEDSKAPLLILHQLISVLYTGGLPNFVQLVAHTVETHWTKC